MLFVQAGDPCAHLVFLFSAQFSLSNSCVNPNDFKKTLLFFSLTSSSTRGFSLSTSLSLTLLSTPTVPPAQPLLRLTSFDKSGLGLSNYLETHKSLSSDLSLGLHGYSQQPPRSAPPIPVVVPINFLCLSNRYFKNFFFFKWLGDLVVWIFIIQRVFVLILS